MCWMTIRRDDAPLASGINACQQHEASSGGHSWGYAISDGTNLKLVTHLGTIDRSPSSEAEAALVHTRLATRGSITRENAHPFLIEWHENNDSSRRAALAHNGTWYDAPQDHRADSFHIARELESHLRSGLTLRDAITQTGLITGETFVVLTDTARCFAHSGRFDITIDDDVIASSGHDSIKTGRVVEL